MPSQEVFPPETLRAVCDVLGGTDGGLTGTEIGQLFAGLGMGDPAPGLSKRHRLFEALHQRQLQDSSGNYVIAFIKRAMAPVRYASKPDVFKERQGNLNTVLAFAGLRLRDDGQLCKIKAAETLDESQRRAGRLRTFLLGRDVHGDVLQFCRAELLQDNYFHAVLEAAKSVANKIRTRAGLGTDGAELVDGAFGGVDKGGPILAFNTLQTKTEKSEHTGMMNLLKGLFGAFRNVTAHAPKVKWTINEQDALDMMSLASLLHRRLDRAVRTRP